MSLELWAAAALCAGVLGGLGPSVIARLPASLDAGPETPSYRSIADAAQLRLWLAAGAAASLTLVALAVPGTLLPAWSVVCGVGSWLAYIDWRTSLLPTRIVWPLFTATIVVVAAEAWWASDWTILVRATIASAVAFGVFWLFWWVGELWRAGGFGFGDVRFSAPLAFVLGSVGGWTAPVGMYLGIILGGVAGVVMKARGHSGSFALGPWMFLGAVLGPLVS